MDSNTAEGRQEWESLVASGKVREDCRTCLADKAYVLAHGYRSGGPPHIPGPCCKSGGRPHCTCAGCY